MRLVGAVLDELGPTYRPLGDPACIEAIAVGLPGMIPPRPFGWMDRTSPAPPVDGARWLTDRDLPNVAALLDADFPDSYARPGVAGVERWAGVP